MASIPHDAVHGGHGHGHDDHHDHHPTGFKRWLTTTNHKDIGSMYLWFSFTMFIVGGILAFDIACTDAAGVAMDKADLTEVLGNLLENATRYAASRIAISYVVDGDISIDDDGPGIPEPDRDNAIARGLRLDNRGEGSGLGLAIVNDVLEANGSSLRLSQSPLGGLRAAFRGHLVHADVGWGLLAAALTAMVAVAFATRAFQRENA